MSRASAQSPVRRSLEEYGRGIAGGLIFAIPLLFTMEVWWTGFLASPARLLAGCAGTYLLLLAYNEYAGLHVDHRFSEVAIDSVEEFGLGLLISAAALALFERIHLEMSAREILGTVVVEGMLVAIGVSVGTAQLGGDPATARERSERRDRHGMMHIVVLSVCGAVLVGANVGPTDEILRLGAEMSPRQLLATMAASLVVAAIVLFFSEFRGSHHLRSNLAPRVVLTGCVVTYAAALLTSAWILWFFGRFDDTSLAVMIGMSVVLGFPATLGAAAGRLLLQ